MQTKALILVLISSICHLAWNSLAKKSNDKLAFLWWAVSLPSIYGVYWLATNWQDVKVIAYYFVCASAIIHAFYIWALASSYKWMDLSFVYPYCRGVGSLGAALGGVFLLQEQLSFRGGLGITLCIAAIFVGPIFTDPKAAKLPLKGIVFTLFTGLTIAAYLLVDKLGVQHIQPVSYFCVMIMGSWLLLFPQLWYQKRLLPTLKQHRSLPFIASIFLSLGGILVFFAMQTAEVSYVVAIRAGGILFSGFAGWLFFKEQVGRGRWASICLITLGIFCIGTA